MYSTIDDFMDYVEIKNPGEKEFHQAVHEVVESLWDYLKDNPHYLHSRILERVVEGKKTFSLTIDVRQHHLPFI